MMTFRAARALAVLACLGVFGCGPDTRTAAEKAEAERNIKQMEEAKDFYDATQDLQKQVGGR